MAVLRGAGALLLLAAALAGCARDPLEVALTDDQLLVHGVLEAGADTVVVRLTETLLRERGRVAGTRGVRGALAELSWEGGAVPMREYVGGFSGCWGMPMLSWDPDAGNPGCYLGVVPGGLRVGERYTLRITLADGRQVRGEARIPPPPERFRPVDGTRWFIEDGIGSAMRVVGPVVLEWQHDPAVAALTYSLHSEHAFRGGVAAPDSSCSVIGGNLMSTPHFQSVGLNLALFCGGEGWQRARPDSLQVRFRVVFFDTAFVRYRELVQSGESVRRREAAVGLEGAVGVFTAAAVAERRGVMVPR